jgi:hypothetical protein
VKLEDVTKEVIKQEDGTYTLIFTVNNLTEKGAIDMGNGFQHGIKMILKRYQR